MNQRGGSESRITFIYPLFSHSAKKELPKNLKQEDFYRVYDEHHLDKFIEEKNNEFHIETMKKWLMERIEQAKTVELNTL